MKKLILLSLVASLAGCNTGNDNFPWQNDPVVSPAEEKEFKTRLQAEKKFDLSTAKPVEDDAPVKKSKDQIINEALQQIDNAVKFIGNDTGTNFDPDAYLAEKEANNRLKEISYVGTISEYRSVVEYKIKMERPFKKVLIQSKATLSNGHSYTLFRDNLNRCIYMDDKNWECGNDISYTTLRMVDGNLTQEEKMRPYIVFTKVETLKE